MVSLPAFADFFSKTIDQCSISEYNLVYESSTATYSPYTNTNIVINGLTGAIDIDSIVPFVGTVFISAINSLGTQRLK